MSDVIRYDSDSDYIGMTMCEYGAYVLYSDYEEKDSECNRLTAINKILLDACEKIKTNYIKWNEYKVAELECYDIAVTAIQQAKEGMK